MAGHARQTTRLSPAAVPVHDDGHMQTGWFQEFHPSSQATRPRRVDSRKSLFHTKCRPKKFSGPGLALPRGPNQCLHVIEIPLQEPAVQLLRGEVVDGEPAPLGSGANGELTSVISKPHALRI